MLTLRERLIVALAANFTVAELREIVEHDVLSIFNDATVLRKNDMLHTSLAAKYKACFPGTAFDINPNKGE